jgi:hypothetical protein
MKNTLTLLFCLLFSYSFAQNDTLCQQPNANIGIDASLGYHDNFGTDNNNYGTDIYLKAFCIPGAMGGRNTNRGLLYFDLSAIPPGSTIISAELKLYATGYINNLLPGHFGNNLSYIEQVTAPWTESTITWNTQPTTTQTNRATLPVSGNASQDYTVNVTAMTQVLINNQAANYGFMFRLDTEDPNNQAALLFFSSDYNDVSKHPQLCVIWGGKVSTVETVVNETSPSIAVFPNPVSDVLTVQSPLLNENCLISIYASNGKLIKHISSENVLGETRIPISGLSQGMYLLVILNDDKKSQVSFIVE